MGNQIELPDLLLERHLREDPGDARLDIAVRPAGNPVATTASAARETLRDRNGLALTIVFLKAYISVEAKSCLRWMRIARTIAAIGACRALRQCNCSSKPWIHNSSIRDFP